jgi:hypothetical protein
VIVDFVDVKGVSFVWTDDDVVFENISSRRNILYNFTSWRKYIFTSAILDFQIYDSRFWRNIFSRTRFSDLTFHILKYIYFREQDFQISRLEEIYFRSEKIYICRTRFSDMWSPIFRSVILILKNIFSVLTFQIWDSHLGKYIFQILKKYILENSFSDLRF